MNIYLDSSFEDTFLKEEAFKKAMTGLLYGEEETNDAWYWFSLGWVMSNNKGCGGNGE